MDGMNVWVVIEKSTSQGQLQSPGYPKAIYRSHDAAVDAARRFDRLDRLEYSPGYFGLNIDDDAALDTIRDILDANGHTEVDIREMSEVWSELPDDDRLRIYRTICSDQDLLFYWISDSKVLDCLVRPEQELVSRPNR